MVNKIKYYFQCLDKMKELQGKRAVSTNKIEQINLNIEIRRLENILVDYDFIIDNILNDEERKYLLLRYRKNISIKKLEAILNKSATSLHRLENSIITKFN
ncbi:hypothetical protein [Clostridium tunisiense]|uniref:hypothetical protein n=1 Tax=Clostridium tunisiense TaxID=219748 RepID=UPI000306ECFC|nr:hypothetical protein [Clostridium tunisiense]